MKIEHRGVDITDIPYFDSITVTPSGVELVESSYDDEARQTLTIVQLTELRNALSAALDHARAMDYPALRQGSIREPRTWKAGDPEPDGVTEVEDKDHDHWVRRAGGQWQEAATLAVMPWSYVLTEWGPVTEATYSRAVSEVTS